MMTPPGPENIATHVPFLARESIYSSEKPYGADFLVDQIDGASMTNHVFDTQPVTIYDTRGSSIKLDLERNGACFVKHKTSLRAEDATDTRSPAMDRYIKELISMLLGKFSQYTQVIFMDYQIRKRSIDFPDGHGKRVEFCQPAAMPHSDFSVEGAWMRMGEIFRDRKEVYADRDFDLINIWKVLSGPNDDWPLAVCDYETIDWRNDTTTNDCIHLQKIGENCLLHYNSRQQWYYMSGMEADDIIVFRNTNSTGGRPCCFHTAFNNPYSRSPPRHSIEVRVVAFR